MNLQTIPEEALKEILALTEAKKTLELREKAQDYFMPFAHHVYENFIEGKHHRESADKFNKIFDRSSTVYEVLINFTNTT